MFEKTVKTFAINFNSYNERSTFESGDLITGQLSFELTKEVKISYITMEVVGKAEVHWSTGSRKRRRHYSAKLEFFKLKSTIMENNGSALVRGICFVITVGGGLTRFLSLSLFYSAVTGSTKLPSGTHVFPFSCQLPQGCVRVCYYNVRLTLNTRSVTRTNRVIT